MAVLARNVFAETMSPEEMAASDRRSMELLAEFDTLKELRKAIGLTQDEVGQKMGTRQVSVAQLEKRSDVHLSTLRDYIEALGGRLELVVHFDGQAPVRLAGFGEGSSRKTSRERFSR